MSEIESQIMELLYTDPTILTKFLFSGVASNSGRISSFSLFLFIRLLHLKHENFSNFLFGNQIDFVFRLRQLSRSTNSHSQYASQIIQNQLTRPNYQINWLKEYSASTTYIIEDLFQDKDKKIENYQGEQQEDPDQDRDWIIPLTISEKSKLKTISQLINKENLIPICSFPTKNCVNSIVEIFTIFPETTKMIGFQETSLFTKKLFEQILDNLEKEIFKQYPPMLNLIGYFLANYFTCLRKIRSIKSLDNISTDGFLKRKISTPIHEKKRSLFSQNLTIDNKMFSDIMSDIKSAHKVSFSLNDILRLFHLIENSGSESYPFKSYIIDCIRNLIKVHDLYKTFINKKIIFEKLKNLLNDDRDNNFNRNCWRAFYQLIKYQEGFVNYLKKNDLLDAFIERMITRKSKSLYSRRVSGQNFTFVDSNGMHYLKKILNMVQIEKARLQLLKPKARPYVRDYQKSMKKDIDTFRESLIIHHRSLIRQFKRYSKSFAGKPYIEIANIYYLIRTQPGNKKLNTEMCHLKDTNASMDEIVKYFKN